MFRPILAFVTLCLAAFLLAPTVASVHEKVTELSIMRETPWNIFQWTEPPQPRLPLPNCGGDPQQLYSEVTQWPDRIRKDEPFSLRGVAQNDDQGRIGVGAIEIDLFLNETKSEPGIALGTVESDANGVFTLTTSLPFDLQASRYSLVAHAKEKRMGCQRYLEHWSDPETDVISPSTIEWQSTENVVAGRNTTFSGRLLDVVGAPVRNATVNVTLDGKTHKLVTDDGGTFVLAYTPPKPGDLQLEASFKGGTYYDATKNATTVKVAEELFVMDPSDLLLPRSTLTRVSGYVYVADAARQKEFTLGFQGLTVATCATCPATSGLKVPLGEDGRFDVEILAPADVTPGSYGYVATGGGLKKNYSGNVSVQVQPALTFEAKHTGFFSGGYEGSVFLADEVGRPLAAPVVVSTPEGWLQNTTAADGSFRFSGTASCGEHEMLAFFNGSEGYLPSKTAATPRMCGYLAFIPPWLVATPWWVWPLAAIALFGAWQAYRAWRSRYAPVIMGGPSLTFAFTEPRDDAAGYAAIGEAVVATAFLEEPLPDGHRLRIGSPRRTQELPIDADLRAHHHLVPEKLGGLPLRAEILDAKGRVVSRRSLTLHVVRYAEEIEARYLRLRETHGASEAVTPREFERWLHERAPGLDPAVARRLVHVFEEADYSPRVAGRAEFAAYLAAEGGVQEVSAHATA